jgi:hypothetical protein
MNMHSSWCTMKLKSVVLIVAVTLLLACGGEYEIEAVEVRRNAGSTGVSGPLHCDPQVLRPGDTLAIEMRVPHPLELAIVAPDGAYYYLQAADDSVPSRLSANEFAELAVVHIDVDSATGIQWVNGKPTKSRIFEIVGEYEVILAENIETEPENTISYTQQITYAAWEERGP